MASAFYLENRLRYFSYLSTTKVDLLYQQISPSLRERLAVTLKIDVPFLEIEAGSRTALANYFNMLKVVLSELHSDHSIGDLDSTAGFVALEMPLRLTSWNDLVFYSGRYRDSIVALGGSLHNLTQRDAKLPPVRGMGSTVAGMKDSLNLAFGDEEPEPKASPSSLTDLVTRAAVLTTEQAQPMEFVARRLFTGKTSVYASNWKVHEDFEDLRAAGSVPIVVASPLYVAERI